jgi:hypothetical protein
MPRIADPDAAHAAALRVARQRAIVGELREDEPRRSRDFAERARLLADLLAAYEDKPSHAILEVAGLFKVGQGRADTMLKHARRLTELYPAVLELLDEGAVAVGTVELLLWVTANAPDAVQAQLGIRIAAELVDLDAADARRLITSTMLEVEAELDEQGQKERHQQAQANRGVWVKPVADGMARIGAEVDEITAQRFALDLQQLVAAEKVHDDRTGVTRSAGQRGADVLAQLPSRYLYLLQMLQRGKRLEDLLPAGLPADLIPSPRTPVDDDPVPLAAALLTIPLRNPVTMYVHTAMATVLDLDQRAGLLEGYGPISAFRSRLLRPTASLQRLLVDSQTGQPIAIEPEPPEPPVGEPDWEDDEAVAAAAQKVRDRLLAMLRHASVQEVAEPGRSPSTALTRFVRARDLGCVGPGCPRGARACELDHLTEVAKGGVTASWNLDAKSPRCHHARHEGWQVRRYDDGTVVWVSPTGQFVVRKSPWRAPFHPREGTELPPPTLDRPDGGKSRSDWYAEPARDLDTRLNGQPAAPRPSLMRLTSPDEASIRTGWEDDDAPF